MKTDQPAGSERPDTSVPDSQLGDLTRSLTQARADALMARLKAARNTAQPA